MKREREIRKQQKQNAIESPKYHSKGYTEGELVFLKADKKKQQELSKKKRDAWTIAKDCADAVIAGSS